MFRGCGGHGASVGWEMRIAGPVPLVRLGRQRWLPRLSAIEETESPVHFWMRSSQAGQLSSGLRWGASCCCPPVRPVEFCGSARLAECRNSHTYPSARVKSLHKWTRNNSDWFCYSTLSKSKKIKDFHPKINNNKIKSISLFKLSLYKHTNS